MSKEEPLSDYEQIRQKNVQRNHEFMRSIGECRGVGWNKRVVMFSWKNINFLFSSRSFCASGSEVLPQKGEKKQELPGGPIFKWWKRR